jgi:hypothetical protein
MNNRNSVITSQKSGKINVASIRPTSENKHTKGAQIWTPLNENNVEEERVFVLRQTHISVNYDVE